MINLILAIISSALVSLTMRLSESFSENKYTKLTFNYLCCIVVAMLSVNKMSFDNSSIIIGFIQGVLLLVSLAVFQKNVEENGVVLTGIFAKLGVLVPTIASVVFFKELPTLFQLSGICLAILAIIIMNRSKENITSFFNLLLLLVVGGGSDVMVKVFQQYGNADYNDQFILISFTVAAIICGCVAIINKNKITAKDVLAGIMIGVPNCLSSVFLLRALATVKAIIAYPTYSVTVIVIVTFAGILFFKEKINSQQKIGIGIILASLILLNL